MSSVRDLILGITPLAEPNAQLTAAVNRAGGRGVLDLGNGGRWAVAALTETGTDAVRVGPGCALRPADLPSGVDLVVLAQDAPWTVAELPGRRVLVEVTELGDARATGAAGLIARGSEGGGRVGELSTFVLLQRLVAEQELPVWAAGGIGPYTAAACVAGGAAGVVLDVQLALLAEASLPEPVLAALRTADGSETVLEGGRRLLRSRTPGAAPIEAGQDAFLAARFAADYRDTATAVRAVRDAVLAARDADPAAILAPGAPLAVAMGTALPIAQGPMTRVSDEPRFAAAVADAGAMPFLALALAGPAQARSMLERTRDTLGDRPWGVGVLGFAPDDVRSAQLDAILDVRPACAIIAGGRPSQAAALEAAGIRTFLHVPSPGLLKQFLEAGARRFVFEGSECGGHVGPRASFPLWEAQLGVLAAFGGDGVEILFAGGIHDARSAAMVAALAGPLTAAGARAGILMGTAYLFTAEAVAAGAILPAFQRQVIATERTELLQTAPGHATRCAVSPFTHEFRAVRQAAEAAGRPGREVWEELEQLNVGRLRVASKGLRRDGDTLIAVDEDAQLADGLYMAGQVAVLRDEVTTIAALHRSVTTDALALSRRDPVVLASPEPPPPLDVAIVGMACVLPGSPDLAEYWRTILGAQDAVTEVPAERWDPAIYHGDGPGKTPSKWGGFLGPVPFDPLRYGIPPTALGSVEPAQLLALEVARRALEHAGLDGVDHARTSVVFGAEAGSDLSNAGVLRTSLPAYVGELPESLDAVLPKLTEDSFPGMLSNVIAGRIANRLDLGGANYTVDAACASSLAAVDVACKELIAGTSDLVLCGAVDLHNGINDYLLFSSVHALSPTGRSRTFDAAADGIALGEGVACVVLKRLADAERDGDRIYAVIKGVGSASDGRALGLTAPRPEGQRRALERAYANARLSPADVGLVEAHGTGTVVGDRTELTTLTAMFSAAGAAAGSCALGSVKSQIGHTKCAAGMAGLIKATLAVHAGVLPPTANLARPNASWDSSASPFAFRTGPAPWAAAAADRVAGVSAFGFGGTNFHVVIQGHSGAPAGPGAWDAELFLFRGRDAAAAHRAASALLGQVTANESAGRPWRLRDLARTAARRADTTPDVPVQAAIVARGTEELAALLTRLLSGEHDPSAGLHQNPATAEPGQVAMLFPGQGSQRTGMLAGLFVAFPELHRYLRLDPARADALFPPAAFDEGRRTAQDDRLRDTRAAQPALGIAGLAVEHLLSRLGVLPDMYAGHSYGELVALSAAGAYDAATLLDLSIRRADAILAAANGSDPGTMAAVSAGAAEVQAVLSDQVVVANHNGPRQVVISGPTPDVDAAVTALRAAGLGAKRIPVACAFHSPVVAAAGSIFGADLATAEMTTLSAPVWSNRTAAPYEPSASSVRAELAAQIGSPVRFADQIEAMYCAGARTFIEAGPGRVLSRLVDGILGNRPHRTVACEPRPDAGLPGFLTAVAQLAVAGVPLQTRFLYAGRDARDLTGLTPPPAPAWTVDGQLVRTRDGRPLPNGLQPAVRLPEPVMPASQPPAGASSDGEALVSEFLRAGRDMVAAQREVLLAYLGGPAPARPAMAPGAPVPPPVIAPAVVEGLSALVPAPAVRDGRSPLLPAPAVVDGLAEPGRAPVVAAPSPVVDVSVTVLEIISERTGYPADMIELDLDLEADLSIDSIKRTEIAGELAAHLGLGGDAGMLADAEVEDLVKARTARAIADWLTIRTAAASGPAGSAALQPTALQPAALQPAISAAAHDAAGAAARPPAATAAGQDPTSAAGGPVPRRAAPRRLVPQLVAAPAEPGDPGVIAGRTFAVGGGAEAGELAAHVALAADGQRADGLILLATGEDNPALPDLFETIRAALADGARHVVVAHTSGGDGAEGLRGLFRSIAREYPDVHARAVELDPAAGPAARAATIAAELTAGPAEPVIVHDGAGRHRIAFVDTPLGRLADGGAGPAGDGAAEAVAAGLDPDSVVVLFGGARGITARFAKTLAGAARCRLELVGRTPVPISDDGPTDPAEIRAALIAAGGRRPAEIERETARLAAGREVAATLGELRALGAEARYQALDVRDEPAVFHLLKEIHAEHGRIDGVVYAAGVIEDRLIAGKTAESFRRVYGTKVDGARAVLAGLDRLEVRPGFTVFYGSIAGALGNRGQCDYAAANDALETLGRRWSQRTGARCLTVHWGPWAPTGTHDGMVGAALEREYARRGIALIDPEEGTLGLLRELAWGDPAETAVVYTASGW
jgi:acyl transferase domain-containing protein